MQFGILTLVDTLANGTMSAEEKYAQVIEEAVFAEQLGFDTFWIGEHHFSNYICPNPVPLLCAIASRTKRIRLGTGVALAAHHDPVHMAEDYAMLDVISGGRVDLVLGRGIYLQGYLGFNQPYDEARPRMEEAVDVIRGAWTQRPFQYEGRFRHVEPIDLQPRPVQQPHPPIWIGGGRGPDSVNYAADQGLHLAMPSVLQPAAGFKGLAETYRARLVQNGRDPREFQLSAGQHTYIADTTEQAEAEFEPYYMGYMRTIAGEVDPAIYEGTELEEIGRRVHASATRIRYPDIARAVAKCGAPEPIAASIRDLRDSLGLTHYWSYFDLGGMPTPMLFRSMELFAKKVMPLVRG